MTLDTHHPDHTVVSDHTSVTDLHWPAVEDPTAAPTDARTPDWLRSTVVRGVTGEARWAVLIDPTRPLSAQPTVCAALVWWIGRGVAEGGCGSVISFAELLALLTAGPDAPPWWRLVRPLIHLLNQAVQRQAIGLAGGVLDGWTLVQAPGEPVEVALAAACRRILPDLPVTVQLPALTPWSPYGRCAAGADEAHRQRCTCRSRAATGGVRWPA